MLLYSAYSLPPPPLSLSLSLSLSHAHTYAHMHTPAQLVGAVEYADGTSAEE